MSFALEAGEAVAAGLERLIREQHGKLLADCDRRGDAAAFVHKARVRCKKVRAALRLARPVIGDKAYRRANRWWRDTARLLSEVRDLTARMEALDALRPHLEEHAGAASVFRLEAQFARELASAARQGEATTVIDALCARVRDWEAVTIPADEREGALAEGLARSYREARRAMVEAMDDPTPELLHEWRKQAKYHALQMRIARRVYPDLEKLIGETRDLAEKLGHLQDIEVLRLAIAPGMDDRLLLALELRRRDLRIEARIEGEKLFELKRGAWADQTLAAAAA